ncbi:unnamed protein product [Paramecium octaurelia]|uniref:Uncharacterized protein n=1 Tax=Paramecium octaurelia TaxID=43137 RepID=A0A8S1Y617_PAROT|nr:unnamed protein product [Paramecium octaurelia]
MRYLLKCRKRLTNIQYLPYLTKVDPSKIAPGFPQIQTFKDEAKQMITDPEIKRKQMQHLELLKKDLVKQVQKSISCL